MSAHTSDGTHTSHCCKQHGCKYGDGDGCPVENGRLEQEDPCEQCSDEGLDLKPKEHTLQKGDNVRARWMDFKTDAPASLIRDQLKFEGQQREVHGTVTRIQLGVELGVESSKAAPRIWLLPEGETEEVDVPLSAIVEVFPPGRWDRRY